MTDYVRAMDLRTKRQRLDDRWSWFCHEWRRIALYRGWVGFKQIWARIGWAMKRATV